MEMLLRASQQQQSSASGQPSTFDDMETETAEVSREAQLERAHAILSAESAQPNSQDPNTLAAARQFIREAARSGSGEL